MNTTLRELAEGIYFPRRLSIRSADTTRQYLYALDSFGVWLGHPAALGDLDDDAVIGWMKSLEAAKLSESTINEKAGRIKAIWNWLARRGMVKTFPTFERLPVPERIPQAWTEAQLRDVFTACGAMLGDVAGVPAPDWWRTLHAVLWNTSERITATLAIRWDWLDLRGGTLRIPAEARKQRTKDARDGRTPARDQPAPPRVGVSVAVV